MAFEATRFSESGLQLLAQLTTSKTLKVKHVYVDSVERDIEDLEQPPSWWATQTSSTMAAVEPEIVLAGAKDTQARLRVKLSLKSGVEETQTIKTLVICACAEESGAEGDEITFCGVMDSAGVEVLSHGGSSIKTSTGVSIYFNFSNSSSITVETMDNPDLVTASDLDRYLTCHKVSDAHNGDLQEVYGAKFFKNLVADLYSGIKFGESAEDTYFGINTDDYDNMCFFTSVEGKQGSVSPIYKFKNNDIDIVKIDIDRTGNESVYSTTFLGNINTNSIQTNEIGSSNTYIHLAGDLIPKSGGNGYNVGSENNYFNNIYCNRFYGQGFTSSVFVDNSTVKTELADGLTFSQYTGETLNNFSNIHFLNDKLHFVISRKNCIEITSGQTKIKNNLVTVGSIDAQGGLRVSQGITAFNDNSNDIGTSSIKFNNIWATYLHGMIPTPADDPSEDIPIGAIVCLCGLPYKSVGSIVQGTYYLGSLTGVPGDRQIGSSESYKMLTSTSQGVTWALAMRIS